MTSEQLEAARAERMRQNGNGALTLEDARTWVEETGLCLFLPRRQYSSSLAPSFVEAVAGRQNNNTPDPAQVAVAEELLVRLERDGVAVRLNLLGQPGEQPDYIVAAWVLPYVYALRGDRDWRRCPQLTGSRQVSPLAVQAYKRLEAGDATIAELTRALGREVSETAVLRAITELWQQLRIIPIVSAPGQPAQWQLLRLRFQKAIAEGASTSQVTAISVLASIYLQAVIAASMEEVEIFLSPLTARSKIREVLRGLVATRQVHTLSMGHAPHFYVAGTLPEFAPATTIYASSAMSAGGYFSRFNEHEDSLAESIAPEPIKVASEVVTVSEPEPVSSGISNAQQPTSEGAPVAARSHFSRPSAHVRNRKPAQSSSSAHPARRTSDARPANGSRSATNGRWSSGTAKSANGNGHSGPAVGGEHGNSRPSNGSRTGESTVSAWSKRNGSSNGSAVADRPTAPARNGSISRNGTVARKEPRTDARSARSSRKPGLTASTKAANSKRFGFTARPKQGTKKRG